MQLISWTNQYTRIIHKGKTYDYRPMTDRQLLYLQKLIRVNAIGKAFDFLGRFRT